MTSQSDTFPSTDPEIPDVLTELTKREPIFHRRQFGTSRADFEGMVVDDFWEVGASGARYTRAAILETLEKRHSAAHEDVWRLRTFAAANLRPMSTC